MSYLRIERRSAPRQAASGNVEISFAQPGGTTVVTARLIENSATGFRIAHQSQDLEPGLEFRLSQPGEPVRPARVIWTRVLDGDRVSGCYFTG
jgi:hypothetical protein